MPTTRGYGGRNAVTQITLPNGDIVDIPLVQNADAVGNISSTPATVVYRLLSSAATDNATSASAAAVTLKNVFGYNARASAVYLKLYAKATAPASTDTPLMTLCLPAGAGFALDFAEGLKFAIGLGYRLTTGSADNDTGAVAAGDILGLNLVVA